MSGFSVFEAIAKVEIYISLINESLALRMPATSPTALRASRALERIGRLLRERENEAGLNPAQWDALRCLASVNRFSRSPSAVAQWLATTRGTASQTAMALERKGFVARAADPRDRRAVLLELTPAGRARLENDPLNAVVAAITGLQPLHAIALGQALAHIADDLAGRDGASFLACAGCRHFTPTAEGGGHCGRFNASLEGEETRQLCATHEIS